MAIKIGKFYITRNNPRKVLKEIADKQNIIDKAIEYLKFIQMDKTDKYIPLRDYKEFGILMNILKGDSDD